jgi:putative ATP-dependent endonuclease of OLD family
MAQLYKALGKRTFAVCDKQGDANKELIEAQVELLLMHEEQGFEDLVLKGTTGEALKRFAGQLDWPQHLTQKYPDPATEAQASLKDYFSWSKGNWGIADFLTQCNEAEIPMWLRDAARALKAACIPIPSTTGEVDTKAELEPHPKADANGTN